MSLYVAPKDRAAELLRGCLVALAASPESLAELWQLRCNHAGEDWADALPAVLATIESGR